jgi:tetratricopeptide (TPR) repeat protein
MQRLAEEAQQAIGRRDFPRAAALLGQLVGQSPRDHGAWYWLAFVHVRMGQPELALPAIQTAVTLDKRNPEYHNLAGVALAEAADYPAAMESLRKALKLKPFLTNAHFNLGKVLQTLRRFDDALEAYQRARKLEPQRTASSWPSPPPIRPTRTPRATSPRPAWRSKASRRRMRSTKPPLRSTPPIVHCAGTTPAFCSRGASLPTAGWNTCGDPAGTRAGGRRRVPRSQH